MATKVLSKEQLPNVHTMKLRTRTQRPDYVAHWKNLKKERNLIRYGKRKQGSSNIKLLVTGRPIAPWAPKKKAVPTGGVSKKRVRAVKKRLSFGTGKESVKETPLHRNK
jgi:hypothetical protein